MRLVSRRLKPQYPDIDMASVREWAARMIPVWRNDTLEQMIEQGRRVMPGMPPALREQVIRETVLEHTVVNVPEIYRTLRGMYNETPQRRITWPAFVEKMPHYSKEELIRCITYLVESGDGDEPFVAALGDQREPEEQRTQPSERSEAGTQACHPGRRPRRTSLRRG